MNKPTGFTVKQKAFFWRAFSASCDAQGLPAAERDPYRRRIMSELCNADHMSQLNRTDHYDNLLLRLATDAGDYELAAHYAVGQERRLAKMVEVTATQLMECQGTDLASASAYVAGLITQAGFRVRQDGPTYWLDLIGDEIHAVFVALDTHRRRILRRVGWVRGLKFDIGMHYALRADGSIQVISITPPPPNYFRVNAGSGLC